MTVLAAYPFLEVMWSMVIFFAFVIWIWILFTVLADIFRRRDASGWVKVAWIVFVVVLPYLGVFVYLIAEHDGMTERAARKQREGQAEAEQYVRSVAAQANPADQVAKAKDLLDNGAITEAEFAQMKQQALAT
jgi:hypothetical protein